GPNLTEVLGRVSVKALAALSVVKVKQGAKAHLAGGGPGSTGSYPFLPPVLPPRGEEARRGARTDGFRL
ncbi:hypothetical protein THAOC_35449, partial [Thalassiosira oceanica]